MRAPTHLLYTGLLGIALLGPFFLRLLSRDLEPFPAVLLPQGATIARISQGEVTFTRTQLHSSPDGQTWTEIPLTDFLAPLPRQFVDFVARTGFGLEPRPPMRIRGLGRVPHPLRERPPETRDEMIRWLRERLLSFEMDPHALRVITVQETVSTKNGSVIRSAITETRHVALD